MIKFIDDIFKIYKKNIELKNFSWLISGKIFQMMIAFVVGLLTARYLGPSDFGLINYSFSYVAFFGSLSTLGLSGVIVKNFVDNPLEQGLTLGSALVLRFISSFISFFVLFLLVYFIDYGETITLKITLIMAIVLLFQPFDLINYWFQYIYKAKFTAISSFIAYLIVALYRFYILVLGKSLIWFAFAFIFDFLVIAILLTFFYYKNNGPSLLFSKFKSMQLLKSSYHYIFSSIMVSIYVYSDKIMLRQLLDDDSVGYYSVATTLVSTWTIILAVLIDAMNPTILRLFNVNKIDYENKNKQLYRFVFYIAIIVSILIFVFADFGIVILYGSTYLPSARPLKILTFYPAFAYLGVARNAWIISENKQKYLKYIYFSAVIINISLNFIFIPILGTTGAAIATLITQICTSLLLPYLLKPLRKNSQMIIDAIFFVKSK